MKELLQDTEIAMAADAELFVARATARRVEAADNLRRELRRLYPTEPMFTTHGGHGRQEVVR